MTYDRSCVSTILSKIAAQKLWLGHIFVFSILISIEIYYFMVCTRMYEYRPPPPSPRHYQAAYAIDIKENRLDPDN